jgi:hypothetical protein
MESHLGLNQTTAGEDCDCEEGIIPEGSEEPTACETTLLRLANLRDAWLVAYNPDCSNLPESSRTIR